MLYSYLKEIAEKFPAAKTTCEAIKARWQANADLAGKLTTDKAVAKLQETLATELEATLAKMLEAIDKASEVYRLRPENEHDTLRLVAGALENMRLAFELLRKALRSDETLKALSTWIRRITKLVINARPENEHDTYAAGAEPSVTKQRVRKQIDTDRNFLSALLESKIEIEFIPEKMLSHCGQ